MIDKVLEADFRVVLLDNGSLSPESVLQARELALALSKRIGCSVDSVSVSHGDRVPAEAIGGIPAATWKGYLNECREGGARFLIVLPLFFGRSYGLRKAREMASSEAREGAPLEIRWAPCLISDSCGLLPDMMMESIIRVLDTAGTRDAKAGASELPSLVLLDHGSPFLELAESRNWMAAVLAERLEGRVEQVIPCSMERREGQQYAFNEPLWETTLEELEKSGVGTIILSQLFLFPGRHAGPGGDIERICQESRWLQSGGRILKTPLLGSNPGMIDLLEARWKQVLASSL